MISLTKELVDVGFNVILFAVTHMPESIHFDVVPKTFKHITYLLETEDFIRIKDEYGLLFLDACRQYYVYTEEYTKCASIRDTLQIVQPEIILSCEC
jgi:hypothetical protein